MMPLHVLDRCLPDNLEILINDTVSYIDQMTLKYNNNLYMLYDGIAVRNSHSDVRYYINHLDYYNILKRSVKFIKYLPIFINYDKLCIYDKQFVKNNNMLFVFVNQNQKVPGFIKELCVNIEHVQRGVLKKNASYYEYGYYDMRFDYPHRLEYILPMFLRCNKIYFHVLDSSHISDNKIFEGSLEFFNLIKNLFNCNIESINTEYICINTENANPDIIDKFLNISDEKKSKMILELLNWEIQDFNTYNDVLDYYNREWL